MQSITLTPSVPYKLILIWYRYLFLTAKLLTMKNLSSFKRLLICLLFPALVGIHATAQSIVASGYSFSASSTTYNYLSGGTSIPAIEADDAYDTVPIGFTFKFCGTNYTDVTVCSNGWLRFGNGVGTSVPNWNYNDQVNSGIQPCVYALYEDVSGAVGTSTYQVTGSAGNRIFKWECRDWLWDYAASTPCVSFQVWLYEATGVIECIYKHESGAVSVGTSDGATIGIAHTSSDWQTLDFATANPTSSSTVYTYDIVSRPPNGQSYVWDPGPACPPPSGLAVTLVNSTSVDFSWTATGSAIGYEYIVDQNSSPLPATTPVSTTNTSATEGGLTPSTLYYIHLRSKCGATNFSSWVTIPFNTLPPCAIPVPPGLIVTSLDTNSATVAWQPISTAVDYEYILKQDKSMPVDNSSATVTAQNIATLKPLQSGQTYYFFVRVKCLGNDSSTWLMDSIYVPIPCHAPDVKFTSVNSSRAVAYWNRPVTSYEYEIITSTSPLANPSTGIKLTSTSHLLPFLDAGTTYYVYTRSYCSDREVLSVSTWAQTQVSTWALGVDNIPANKEALSVYPNPADIQIHVSINMAAVNEGTLSVTDVTGRVVKAAPVNGRETVVDIAGLPAGLYILHLNSADIHEQVKFTKH